MKTYNALLALALFAGVQAHAQFAPSKEAEIDVKAKVTSACEIALGDGTAAVFEDRVHKVEVDLGEIGLAAPAATSEKSVSLFEQCNEDYSLRFLSTNGGLKQDAASVQQSATPALQQYQVTYTDGEGNEQFAKATADMIDEASTVIPRPLAEMAGVKQARLASKGTIKLAVDQNVSLPVGNYADVIMIDMSLDSEGP